MGRLSRLLRGFFGLFISENTGRRPEYPDRSPLYVPSRSGRAEATNTLYLGQGFGQLGEVTQALYGAWAPTKLLDVHQVADLTSNRQQLKEFLCCARPHALDPSLTSSDAWHAKTSTWITESRRLLNWIR